MLSWMFENKVSEYQQYQDALAEDEFFDEDQVSCWWKLENYQMFSHHQSLPCLTVKEEENTESYLFRWKFLPPVIQGEEGMDGPEEDWLSFDRFASNYIIAF